MPIFLAAAAACAGSGMIKEIKFNGQDDSNELVSFYLDGPWLPKVFAIKGEKPRVVFDFLDTGLDANVPSSFPVKGKIVENVRVGRHAEKTRVVFDLGMVGAEDVNFEQKFDDSKNILTIILKRPGTPSLTADETVAEKQPVMPDKSDLELPSATVARPEPKVLISEITFDDNSGKGEMVLFKLNGFYPPEVSGQERGVPTVTCLFQDANLGSGVFARKNVHGEFINRISVSEPNDLHTVRVTIELVPGRNYDLQQVFFKEDSLFVIIVNSYDVIPTGK